MPAWTRRSVFRTVYRLACVTTPVFIGRAKDLGFFELGLLNFNMRFANPIRLLLSTALLLAVGVAAGAHAQNYKKPRSASPAGPRRSAPAPQHQQTPAHQSPSNQPGGGRAYSEPQQRAPQQQPTQSRPQAQPQQQQPAPGGGGSRLAPIERREGGATVSANPGGSTRGEHLAEWMNVHRNLSPPQQQQALENEPGFHDLPQATQQRMRDRLAQLNSMPADQRDRLIQRNEYMEHLTPQQRDQVGTATRNWASLPPDQKSAVGRSFRALRQLPPDQRAAALNSGRYTYGFNPQQRSALSGLMGVEPMLPPEQH